MLSFDVFTESGMYKFYFTKLNYDDGIIVSIYGDLNNTITVESKIKSQNEALREFISKYNIEIIDLQ